MTPVACEAQPWPCPCALQPVSLAPFTTGTPLHNTPTPQKSTHTNVCSGQHLSPPLPTPNLHCVQPHSRDHMILTSHVPQFPPSPAPTLRRPLCPGCRYIWIDMKEWPEPHGYPICANDETKLECPTLADPNFDFGNAYYNDHHFHYGYGRVQLAVMTHKVLQKAISCNLTARHCGWQWSAGLSQRAGAHCCPSGGGSFRGSSRRPTCRVADKPLGRWWVGYVSPHG